MLELEVWLCPIHESLDKVGTLKPLDNCVACLRVQRDELLAEVAAMVKDRERLDWLECSMAHDRWIPRMEPVTVSPNSDYGYRAYPDGDLFDSLREAIDAAIAQAAPEQEKP